MTDDAPVRSTVAAGETGESALLAERTADSLVTELVPDDLDWRGFVRAYPKTALALAALGGYLIGRRHGEEIVESVSSLAAETVTQQVTDRLGG